MRLDMFIDKIESVLTKNLYDLEHKCYKSHNQIYKDSISHEK